MKKIKSILQSIIGVSLFYGLTGWVMVSALSSSFTPIESLSGVHSVVLFLAIPIGLKFIIQMGSAFIYPLVENIRSQAFAASSETPKVSVLIPAWNEEVGILKTLRSVLSARYSSFEVVVINDGSTDNTHHLVTEFIEQYEQSGSKVDIHYVRVPNGGKAKAMNAGLKIAKGEIIITIDADSIMKPCAIEQFVKRFNDSRVGAVAGNVVVGNRRKPIELMQQLEYMFGFFFKRAESNFGSVYIIGGAAAAYRKTALIEVGGFDESIITEDVELSMRLLNHGFKTRYAAQAVVFTEGPSDWKALARQRLRWKYGRLLTFAKYSNMMFGVEKQHNPYLTCFLLPLAVYAEVLLLLMPLLFGFAVTYIYMASAFLPMLFMILCMASLISLVLMLDASARFHMNLLLLTPVAWALLMVVEWVEFIALVNSVKKLSKKEELKWQKWSRVGIVSASVNKLQNDLDVLSGAYEASS